MSEAVSIDTYIAQFWSFGTLFYSKEIVIPDITQLVNIKVRVSTNKRQKKRACPARVAEAGQENIETVHEPKPIQAADTLWGQGRRAMKDLHDPQTQVFEEAYAIKVSMSCSFEHRLPL